jgi:phosphomannomutase/phosphoglucomutase
MREQNIIFTFSGIRGIYKKNFDDEYIKMLAAAFGIFLKNTDTAIIIGRDTRPSSSIIKEKVIEGLSFSNKSLIDLDICPTPVIVFAKNKLHLDGGVIITGSHNPPEWNGLKLLSTQNYLNEQDLDKLRIILKEIEGSFQTIQHNYEPKTSKYNPIPAYLKELYERVDQQELKRSNHLRVVVDTGAGAAKMVTPLMLTELGCQVKAINNDMLVNEVFPREIEPIAKNLRDLMMEVWQEKSDIGFAHDSDGDRLAIIGNNGVAYSEDIGLALIMDHYLSNDFEDKEGVVFVTNIASSLVFDAIAKKHGIELIRTPIGECFLIDKIHEIITERKKFNQPYHVFGGEGSCGGVIDPTFNATRDGIFAAAKITEILVKSGQKISKLVSSLPKYYSYRELIKVKAESIPSIIIMIKEELINEGEEVLQLGYDLKFGKDKEWFVLIHPSNTEPVIRVISESKSDSSARLICETTAALISMLINERKK